MSIPVPLDRLRAALEERGGNAYVLTVSEDGRSHVVHCAVRWEGDALAADVGSRSAANATARPSVSLPYPVRFDGDYSLIVDGSAAATSHDGGHRLLITPTKAVLHRPAPAPDPSSACSADCVPLFSATGGSKTERGARSSKEDSTAVRRYRRRSAPRDGGEQVDLVAVRQRPFEVLVDRAATTVQHESVAQVRAVGDRRPQADPLPLGLVEELLQGGTDGESNVSVDVVPPRSDAPLDEKVHSDARRARREEAPQGRE